MTLIPWRHTKKKPVVRDSTPLADFRRELDRVFDRFLEPWTDIEGTTDWLPSVTVSETDDEVVVRAELAGVKPKDVEVKLSGNMLTISGEKRDEIKDEKEDAFYCERTFGSFRRTIELPPTADTEDIHADQKDGVLTVRVHKLATAEPKRIEVKSGDLLEPTMV